MEVTKRLVILQKLYEMSSSSSQSLVDSLESRFQTIMVALQSNNMFPKKNLILTIEYLLHSLKNVYNHSLTGEIKNTQRIQLDLSKRFQSTYKLKYK